MKRYARAGTLILFVVLGLLLPLIAPVSVTVASISAPQPSQQSKVSMPPTMLALTGTGNTGHGSFWENSWSWIVNSLRGGINWAQVSNGIFTDGFPLEFRPHGFVTRASASAFADAGHIELTSVENQLFSAVIDQPRGFAYFGTGSGTDMCPVTGMRIAGPCSGTSRAAIVKVNLSNFTRVGSILLDTYVSSRSAVIDQQHGYAYFATSGGGNSVIVKVDLATFTRIASLIIDSDAFYGTAVIDQPHGFAYFTMNGWPADTIVKVDLATFSVVGSLTLNSGEYSVNSAVIDQPNGFAYFDAISSIVKIDLSTFTRVGALPLNSGDGGLFSAVIDQPNGFAYFGTGSTPSKVVKVDLSTFTRVGSITLVGAQTPEWYGAVIDQPNGYAYFGTYTDTGTLVEKVDLSTFTRVGAMAVDGWPGLGSAVIDQPNGLAYFGTMFSGTWGYPGSVEKINLATFTHTGTLILHSDETMLYSAVIDQPHGYAYFGIFQDPGMIVKVDLATFTRVGAITLNPGENELRAAVIDQPHGFAYFATSTDPGIIVKVDLATFTRVGAITLNPGESFLYSAVIDQPHGFAYFGTYTEPGIVVKVDLSTFTRVGAVDTGEDDIGSAVIDEPNGFAYFGTETNPGIVVKVDLSTFTLAGTLTLNSGERNLMTAVIDQPRGYAYFGTYPHGSSTPSKVVKVNLSTFTRVGAVTLDSGESQLVSAVIDQPNGYAYFGTNSNIVVQVDLSTFTRTDAVSLEDGDDYLWSAVVDQPHGFAYFGTSYASSDSGRVVRVSLTSSAPVLDHFTFDTISSSQTVGVPFSITITAKDSHGNTMIDYAGTNTLSDLTGTITPATTTPFTGGVWTGSVTTRASMTGDTITTTGGSPTKSGTSTQFDVNADSLDHFVISPISGSPTAGTPFNITVTAEDVYNNTVTDYTGTSILTVSAGTISPTSTTGGFSGGVWTGSVTLTTAGTGMTIGVSGGGKAGTSNPFTVNPSALDHFTFSMISSPQAVGTAFNVTIAAKDLYENTIINYTDTNTLAASNGAINPTSTAQFMGGSWTGSVTLDTAGTAVTISTTGGGELGISNSFTVNAGTITITVTSTPTGSGFVRVDGSDYATPQSFMWAVGSAHNLTALSPVSGGSGVQYIWQSWNDTGAQTHQIIVPSTPVTFTASYRTQYMLTMAVAPPGGGSTTPITGWQNAGVQVALSASPSPNYNFLDWLGSGSGNYTGPLNSCTVTMNGAITETAEFAYSVPVLVTMTVNFTIIGGGSPSAPIFNYVLEGISRHATLNQTADSVQCDSGSPWLVTPNPLMGSGVSERWISTQALNGTESTQSLTFSFQHQYYVTMQVNPTGGGTLSPASGWQNAGASVSIQITPFPRYTFQSWSGTGSVSYTGTSNPASITVNGAIGETATTTASVLGSGVCRFVGAASVVENEKVLSVPPNHNEFSVQQLLLPLSQVLPASGLLTNRRARRSMQQRLLGGRHGGMSNLTGAIILVILVACAIIGLAGYYYAISSGASQAHLIFSGSIIRVNAKESTGLVYIRMYNAGTGAVLVRSVNVTSGAGDFSVGFSSGAYGLVNYSECNCTISGGPGVGISGIPGEGTLDLPAGATTAITVIVNFGMNAYFEPGTQYEALVIPLQAAEMPFSIPSEAGQ